MVPEIEKFDEESHERQLRKVQSSKRSNKLLTCESVDQCFKNSSGVSARQKSTLETESDNPAKYNIDYLLMQHAKQVSKKNIHKSFSYFSTLLYIRTKILLCAMAVDHNRIYLCININPFSKTFLSSLECTKYKLWIHA